MDREWLARRIEMEAWAYAKADHLTADRRLGRVLGFLEVGVHAGFWSAEVAAGVGESVRERYGLARIRRRLTR